MSQSFAGCRLLAVHAHPDDEASKGAATTALYTSQGVEVMIATFTGGEAGSILNPALQENPKAIRDIAGLRREEMARAATELGAQHRWIGFVDSGLPEGDPEVETPHGCFYRTPTDVAMRPLIHLIRSFRPHVVTTYDEMGGYPHPDHIKTHEVTMEAVSAAADGMVNPELGAPWQVQKIYYNEDLGPKKWLLLHEALTSKGIESPFGDMVERWHKRSDQRVTHMTTAVECAEYFPHRERALLAHATQIDPNGGFFSEANRVAREHWRTEEFELAVDLTGRDIPNREEDFWETDLFAGITLDSGERIPDEGWLVANDS